MKRALWLLVLSIGCGSRFGAGTPEATDAGIQASPRLAACRSYAQALCERVEACAPFLARTGLGRGSLCVDAVAERCFETAGLGGSQRTPEALSSCAEETRKSTCDAFLESFPEPCALPPGKLADGAGCAFSEQCASTFCAREADVACGVCMAAPRAGERCVQGACARGLLCTSAGACVAPARLGQPCGPNDPCARLLFCDTGVCVPRRELGEGCAGFGQCDTFGETSCAANSLCVATRVVGKGQACDLTANALVLCEAPYRCIDDVCAEGHPQGATCGSAGSHECAGFQSECIRGRCVAPVVEACQK